MKLVDFALKFDRPDIPVILVDAESQRVAFEGTADSLLDYSGIDYRKVSRIDIRDGAIRISVK